jgi:hypothetical protein
VLTLAFVVLCASALAWLRAHDPARRRLWLAGTGLLLALELVPAPRTLYSAEVPRFFARVAAEPGDGRLLDLPFGVRDGTSNAGNFSARSMFFQTAHAKPLIGGYLSRVSSRRVSDVRSDATLDALIVLSEGRALPPDRRAHLLADGPAFVRRARLGFVVVDTAHVSPDDMSLVVRAFRLERLDAEGPLELYRPTHD